MELFSSAFVDGKPIPFEYSRAGNNISPPLTLKNIPENTKSLALIMDDSSGPLIRFVHWIVWNIPPNITDISRGEDIIYLQGKNSLRKQGYVGPFPPFGEHNYFFTLYALDILLDLKSGATKKELEKVMSGHIIAKAQLRGTFKR